MTVMVAEEELSPRYADYDFRARSLNIYFQ